MAQLSPMMQHYVSIKEKHKDHIIFYRLGDFYEMFFEDALLVSKELELTLTGRDCGLEERAPMCGVPYHSSEAYIARLIKKGYKVAICEQVEDPKNAKGMVKREVVRVITPGTLIESNMLDEEKNNYIASVYNQGDRYGIVFGDISTGEMLASEFLDSDHNKIKNEISRFMPSEVIFNSAFLEQKEMGNYLKEKVGCCAECLLEEDYQQEDPQQYICKRFAGKDFMELSLDSKDFAVKALIGMFHYLENTQQRSLDRMVTLTIYEENQYMMLDSQARRNLELTETMLSKEKKGSLLWVLDKTKTPMGKRTIRSWIEKPLIHVVLINKRINAVAEFVDNPMLRDHVCEGLNGIYDIERLMTRIVYGTSGPRELRSLAQTLQKLPQIKAQLENCQSDQLKELYQTLDPLEDVCQLIDLSIEEEPPISLKEGWVIRKGYHPQLDEMRLLLTDTKRFLAEIEAREKEKTGIKTLKVGYNKVFGYYIEISKSYIAMAPEEYIRKQTLSNCERYITQELKELEDKIAAASENMLELERTLYEEIRVAIAANLVRTQATASAIAQIDVLVSFAMVSQSMRYVRPLVNLSDSLQIKEGRHPVVEAISSSLFVANDIHLDRRENQIAVITGPNMAGKSTYMRQTALIVLMAQIGCFVPASYAEIGIVDGIFTRVGAADDLTTGQSTFMVEMNEVSVILSNATSRSLLILDEIGRGTSTFDGMSIARAVIEYIADTKKLGAKTLFATHYHELTDLEDQYSNIKNYNIAVKKRDDGIVFLRKIVRGGTDDSFGIEVSKLAGIPESIVKRAYQILKALEAGETVTSKTKKTLVASKEPQLGFADNAQNQVIDMLKAIDVQVITPIEAMNLLDEMKRKLQ